MSDVEFDAGERVIWSGRPIPLWFALRRAWQPVLMGIVFLTVFAAYLYDLNQPAPRIDATLSNMIVASKIIFATITGVLGLLGFAAALWLWLRAYRTSYHLTNRRVVIDTAGPIQRRTSMPLEHLRFIELRSGLVGPSDLIFNETRRFSIDGWGVRGEGFLAIPEATRVERLVRDAIEQTFATRSRNSSQ